MRIKDALNYLSPFQVKSFLKIKTPKSSKSILIKENSKYGILVPPKSLV